MINGKRFFFIFAVLILITAVAYSFRFIKLPPKNQEAGMSNFKIFETKNPVLNFTFEYPGTGWTPAESRGSVEKYDLVYLKGPTDEKTKFTALIHITVRPLEAGKTASELLEAYLKIDSNLTQFETSHREAVKIDEEKAASALCEYKAIPSYSLRVPFAAFKKRMVFVVKNDRSYEFTLNTLASKFNAYAPILEHVLKTFRFKK
jgi:hypothetical protein